MHIPKMTDLRHIETGLTEQQKREAIAECARMKQRAMLGTRYLLHPANAPQRGTYNPLTGARLA